ncbi:MAG TPA: hypothetical protein VGG03_05685 [Thermoanaerobaculia bacterium]|jgi:hypothetical protein
MIEPLTPTSIEALIEGGVSGQVAVGNYNVQIHAEHGAVVHFSQPPAPRLRPCPVLLRPRPVRGLVDRQEDVTAALSAVESCLPVEVHGPPGIGKSTLLRHLANVADAGALPDGVVHLAARQQPAADLVQALFEAFYECDAPFKPSSTQARLLLRDRKALILLDDCELGREAAEELLDTGPACAFILASRERCLWGEGRAIHLGALPPGDARTLFERELGRPLMEEEGAAFESLHVRLEGNPLRLLQVAVQVREGRPMAEAAPIHADTVRQTLALLPDEEKRVLSALAAVGGSPVGATHVASLADVPDPMPALNALLERKLVQAHSPRYSLTGDLAGLLPSTWDLAPWGERALAYFLPWAEAHREDPLTLGEEMGVLRHLLDWAVQAGRHEEALRLGRALDTACAVGGRWGAWEQILERVRTAAGALGDRATEAWALHQLGSRLLCLDDRAGAQELLTRALAIRESLGDRAGAAVTRHNLGLLGVAPPPETPIEVPPRSLPPVRLLPWLAAAVLVFLIAAVAGVRFLSQRTGQDRGTQPATPILNVEETPSEMSASVTIEEPTPTPAPKTDTPPDEGMGLLDISRDNVEFPRTVLGTETRVETISVSNEGDSPLRVAGISFTDNPGGAFDWKSSCPGRPVDPGDECEVQILFHPPRAGDYRATLSIETDRQEQRTVEVSGTVLPIGGTEGEIQQGWCCAGGEAFQSSEAVCAERGGTFFQGRRQAQTACETGQTGCCLNGTFEPNVPEEECAQRGGAAMTPGQALIQCRPSRETPPPEPQTGWCCIEGEILELTPGACDRRQGTFFKTSAEAEENCPSPIR